MWYTWINITLEEDNMEQKEIIKFNSNKIIKIIIVIIMLIVFFAVFIVIKNFGAPQNKAELEQFTIPLDSKFNNLTELATLLKNKGFIKSKRGFKIAYLKTIESVFSDKTCVDCFDVGAFKISKNMSAFKIADIIKNGPYMKWVIIPEGLRKEQVGEIIGNTLQWDEDTKRKWIGNYTSMKYDEIEGVYFPDTYLLPVNETGLQIADRLRERFNTVLKPYYEEALRKNIKWDTLIKIASIIQREAAGKEDMPLIAGIIWNRLLNNPQIKLEVDSTIQYIRDSLIHYNKIPLGVQLSNYSSDGSWWEPIKIEDIKIESPYNTYINKGLPPHPICNPGIDAIYAALNPEETECFYYIHDHLRIVHCAKNLKEHQANIEKYLK